MMWSGLWGFGGVRGLDKIFLGVWGGNVDFWGDDGLATGNPPFPMKPGRMGHPLGCTKGVDEFVVCWYTYNK